MIFRSLLSVAFFFLLLNSFIESVFFHRVKILSLSLSRFLLEDDDDDDDDQKMFIIHMALYERVPRFEKKSHKTPLAKLDAKRKTKKKRPKKKTTKKRMMMTISKRTKNTTRVDTRKKCAEKNPIALSRNVVVGTACVVLHRRRRRQRRRRRRRRSARGVGVNCVL